METKVLFGFLAFIFCLVLIFDSSVGFKTNHTQTSNHKVVLKKLSHNDDLDFLEELIFPQRTNFSNVGSTLTLSHVLYKCGANDNVEIYDSSKRCDFVFDCKNRADELGCFGCAANQFRCASGKRCVNASFICNGFPDCEDFSDEMNCDVCPPNEIRCGKLSTCFNPATSRCDRVFDCANGFDELNCFDDCRGRISCAFETGCFELNERCNGIVQCSDFSDELNCTQELCRAEKGSFLCANHRCIPSIWTCDRSNDCGPGDSSDENVCLKNSVITAAIIGSLICGMLMVIAISCACKLLRMRRLEHFRAPFPSSLYSTAPPMAAPFIGATDFPFPVTSGDLDASLFRLDHSAFLREPPPSYASTMGGYHPPEANGFNNSYIEQYRIYRRQRRTRRLLRRQQRQQQQLQQQQPQQPQPLQQQLQTNNAPPSVEVSIRHDDGSIIVPDNDYVLNLPNPIQAGPPRHSLAANDTDAALTVSASSLISSGSERRRRVNSIRGKIMPTIRHTKNDGDPSISSPSSVCNLLRLPSASSSRINSSDMSPATISAAGDSPSIADNLNIELEAIPTSLTNFDCDFQPLIR